MLNAFPFFTAGSINGISPRSLWSVQKKWQSCPVRFLCISISSPLPHSSIERSSSWYLVLPKMWGMLGYLCWLCHFEIIMMIFYWKSAHDLIFSWVRPYYEYSGQNKENMCPDAHLGVGRGEYSPALFFDWIVLPYFYLKCSILCPILTWFALSFHELMTPK